MVCALAFGARGPEFDPAQNEIFSGCEHLPLASDCGDDVDIVRRPTDRDVNSRTSVQRKDKDPITFSTALTIVVSSFFVDSVYTESLTEF